MAIARRIRVFVADDHPLYREGVTRAIKGRRELELVGDAGDGREALAGIRSAAPDVALLDAQLPSMTGLEVAAALTRERSATRVLMLSAYVDAARVYDAVAAGAAGYISKEMGRAEICAGIRRVARGETVLAPQAQAGLRDRITRPRPNGPGSDLTARERETLKQIALGLSAPQIAARTNRSVPTVKGYLQSIYRKLDVHDRAAATAEAVRLGLID